jgi:hypothetical protein
MLVRVARQGDVLGKGQFLEASLYACADVLFNFPGAVTAPACVGVVVGNHCFRVRQSLIVSKGLRGFLRQRAGRTLGILGQFFDKSRTRGG